MLVGGVIGGLSGAGIARGMNRLARADQPEARWSSDFLNALVRSSVLRYLAVAHFGRGRGKYVEGEAPPFWRAEVEQQFNQRAATFRALWDVSLATSHTEKLMTDLHAAVTQMTIGVLERLYPVTVPVALRTLGVATRAGIRFALTALSRDQPDTEAL